MVINWLPPVKGWGPCMNLQQTSVNGWILFLTAKLSTAKAQAGF